jgi:hypothetical protein
VLSSVLLLHESLVLKGFPSVHAINERGWFDNTEMSCVCVGETKREESVWPDGTACDRVSYLSDARNGHKGPQPHHILRSESGHSAVIYLSAAQRQLRKRQTDAGADRVRSIWCTITFELRVRASSIFTRGVLLSLLYLQCKSSRLAPLGCLFV